jgi:hypothetical protein
MKIETETVINFLDNQIKKAIHERDRLSEKIATYQEIKSEIEVNAK